MQGQPEPPTPPMQRVVLDTNILLDVWVFADAVAQPLRTALESQAVQWIATQAMRDELARVLGYPQIVPRLAFYRRTAAEVLGHFDRHATLAIAPAKCAFVCKDADDQKFIDLAAAYGAALVSKDRAILCMAKRMHRVGVAITPVWRGDAELQ